VERGRKSPHIVLWCWEARGTKIRFRGASDAFEREELLGNFCDVPCALEGTKPGILKSVERNQDAVSE
jgi:hypothetical protein